MRQLNNKQFDTKEGASASLSEIVSSQFAPSVSQKDEIMRYTNLDKKRTESYFQYIQLQINLLTKKGNGERIHFLDYNDNSIHFAINEIVKTLYKLKKGGK